MRENNSNFIKHNLDEDVILKKWIDIIERVFNKYIYIYIYIYINK